MKKYTLAAILQLIAIILLSVAMTLCWISYVYEDTPLISAICLTILNALLLVFNSIEYIIAVAYYREKHDEKD